MKSLNRFLEAYTAPNEEQERFFPCLSMLFAVVNSLLILLPAGTFQIMAEATLIRHASSCSTLKKRMRTCMRTLLRMRIRLRRSMRRRRSMNLHRIDLRSNACEVNKQLTIKVEPRERYISKEAPGGSLFEVRLTAGPAGAVTCCFLRGIAPSTSGSGRWRLFSLPSPRL